METSGFAAAGANGLRIGIRSGNIAAFITALEGITDVTVLANPKILAVNKQEGSVLIGKKVGYRSQTTQTETMTTQKVEFLETGTRLVFRPFIGEGGYIRMDIYPKDSGATVNEGIPDETTTELRTNIMVKDGQTVVIGGLFRESVSTGRSQVPLLGDLPIIGAAFRRSTDENNREEVIILLTPHIIEEPEQTQGEARAADVARKRYGARQNLQWVSRSRLAEDRYTRAVRYYADGYREQAVYELNAALELRPTYLEALRLKERIIRETSPDGAARVERIMLEVMDREEAPNWRRR
jgi:type II secretory pathway component GspD/PulD (secretin)